MADNAQMPQQLRDLEVISLAAPLITETCTNVILVATSILQLHDDLLWRYGAEANMALRYEMPRLYHADFTWVNAGDMTEVEAVEFLAPATRLVQAWKLGHPEVPHFSINLRVVRYRADGSEHALSTWFIA